MEPVRENSDGNTTPEQAVQTSETKQTKPAGTNKSSARGFLLYAIIALGLALFIRFFIAAPYVVSGSSMEPNFQNWNYLIVDHLTYDFSAPQRGDIIVFKLPEDPSRTLIKRIIGLPGETVVLSGKAPTVTIINKAHPKGFTLSEPYVAPADYGGASDMRITLGQDQYFVLGDNRIVSADSRLWGPLPRNDIIGKVLLRLYPFNEIGVFPAESRYQ